MTAFEVLEIARADDILVEPRGESLFVSAPAGRVTVELRTELVAHKPLLMALLRVDQFVLLKGGLVVPLMAYALAINLEARGFALTVDENHELQLPNDERLTQVESAAIRRWRTHLAAIVEYRVPEGELPL